ncbi:HD domain-containing protein [candidate division KSB1 bacterium]|nr:HD domain-containing protein [candidate division KSB1 bacterium]
METAVKRIIRDWELVAIRSALGRKFAYDIFPAEFHKITSDLSLVLLSDPQYLKAKAESGRVAPMIKRGAEISTKMIQTLLSKNCTVVPVLMPGKPKSLNALTNFSRQQSLMLAGRVYSCVDDWLRRVRKERAIGVIQAVKKHRTPLLQSLNNALKDWEAVIVTLVNDILVADESLTIMSLFDDFIGDQEKAKKQKEHSVEVAVLALMLARKCNLPVEEIKELGLAAMIHDIGMVVYEQKLKEIIELGGVMLEPNYIKDLYDKHPLFGALLVSKKNGDPISGVTEKIREIIFEHENNNNETEPYVGVPEFKDELQKMKIPENVIYTGDNQIFPATNRLKDVFYPDNKLTKRFISIQAQILHISELYVTTLNQLRNKNIDEPHKLTIQLMLNRAGEEINGQVFEVFFNYLIPPAYYPDNLVVVLFFKNKAKNKKYEKYNNHTGVVTTVLDLSKHKRKMIRVLKTPSGKEVTSKVSFDLIYDKKDMYLRIDDWGKKN